MAYYLLSIGKMQSIFKWGETFILSESWPDLLARDVTRLVYVRAHWGDVTRSDVGGGWEESAGGGGPGEWSGFQAPEGQFSSLSSKTRNNMF